MTNDSHLSIASEFSDAPGARYRTNGPKSGQEFYEDMLRPRFKTAIKDSQRLMVDLDGTWGYASSFISESFGKLSEEFGLELVKKHLILKSDEDELLLEYIMSIMENPGSAK